MYGFGEINLGPKNSTKVKVNFSSLSYLSKPTTLAFDYQTSNQIVFDLDKDTGPLTDAQVYGTNVPNTVTSTAAPPAAVVAAPVVKAAPQAMPQVAPQTNFASASAAANQATSSGMQSLKDNLNATKQRLANMGSPGTPGGNNSVGASISQTVNDSLARLKKMSEGLPHGQNATQSTGAPGSSAIA
jgi:hypothetical protein